MSKSREVVISSGNVLNKSINFRKGNDAATEELVETLGSILESQKEVLLGNYSNSNSFEVVEDYGGVGNEERDELKIAVKIFLYCLDENKINEAISRSLKHCNVDYLDTLVISFAGQSETTRLTLDMIKSVWSVLEESVKVGKVKLIGLCDVDTQLFMQLYTWASVKPRIVQINLASCCVVPPELADFCKQESIQLLTHSDPINILPEDKLGSLLKQIEFNTADSEKDGPIAGKISSWEAKWVLRYQIHLKSRGVLSNKGYIIAVGFS